LRSSAIYDILVKNSTVEIENAYLKSLVVLGVVF